MKLKINYKKKWKIYKYVEISQMFLTTNGSKKHSRWKSKYLETNAIRNRNIPYQNIWNTPKAVLKGRFITTEFQFSRSVVSNSL